GEGPGEDGGPAAGREADHPADRACGIIECQGGAGQSGRGGAGRGELQEPAARDAHDATTLTMLLHGRAGSRNRTDRAMPLRANAGAHTCYPLPWGKGSRRTVAALRVARRAGATDPRGGPLPDDRATGLSRRDGRWSPLVIRAVPLVIGIRLDDVFDRRACQQYVGGSLPQYSAGLAVG